MNIEIQKITKENVAHIALLIGKFRVALKSYKGITTHPNVEAGLEEAQEYLEAGFPIYAAVANENYIGYMVCRIEEPCVWVESIFVEESYRRCDVASLLLECAEKIAHSYGENTVYFNVHPNNHRMISFLRKHGYTVLNLIEIRKPYPKENLRQEISVGEHTFDY